MTKKGMKPWEWESTLFLHTSNTPVVELRKISGATPQRRDLRRHALHGGPHPQWGEIPPSPR